VSTAARVNPAEAAAGDPIRMGRTNLASGTSTELQTLSTKPTFRAIQLGGGTALRAEAGNGRAVMAVASHGGTGVFAYSPNHNGVFARSPNGTAISGASTHGVGVFAYGDTALLCSGAPQAARFIGPVRMQGFQDLDAVFQPPAPLAGRVRLFALNDGSGKGKLCVRFPTGAVQVIATEP